MLSSPPSEELKLTRLIARIMDVLKLECPNELRDLLKDLWDHWSAHPFFEEYYTEDRFGYAPRMHIFEPLCLATYKHERGVRGDTSWSVGGLTEVLAPATLKWAGRTLGEFVGVEPVGDWVVMSNPIKYRMAMISNSPLAGGNAYECRMVLKGMLPRKLHPLVGKARRANSKPKYLYLGNVLAEAGVEGAEIERQHKLMRRKPSVQPVAYRSRSKGDLFLIYGLTDKERAGLSPYFVDLLDFWRVATGDVKSIDASQYVNQQLSFPGWEV